MEEQDHLMMSEVKIEIDVAEDTPVFWMMENSNQGQWLLFVLWNFAGAVQ